jgi:hypothetical protein
MEQVTGMIGNRGGRGGKANGGFPGKAASFVTGFLSGGEADKGRGRRRGGRRRR